MTDAAQLAEGTRRVRQLKAEIDHFYTTYREALKTTDINFQGELHKYACIRLAGFLEQMLHTAITAQIKASASPTSAAFASSFWKNAPNLNPDALRKLIGRFASDEWSASLEQLADEKEIMERLGVLLKVRNDTSHGKSYAGSAPSVDTHKNSVDELYSWACSTFLGTITE